jgi:O-antigen biosynthesis protein
LHRRSARSGAKEVLSRAEARGRFLYTGAEKFFVRGVTYGPFGSQSPEREYHDLSRVRRDFAQMASLGFNAIRTYTVPPPWLLNVAEEHGLRVMVGIPWEQHVTFLDDDKLSLGITERVRAGVKACAGHPAVLCYALGNEIPAPIVRWHRAYRIERFLRKLYDVAKNEDPDGLFTYVNYPTTEYLELPFLDFISFNVYLNSQTQLASYLARLLNVAGERPLLIGELGMDSSRNGELEQARTLEQQIQTISRVGCTGTFVFSWTDEWHRGGFPITDWDFGLTRRDRTAKPALSAVARAFSQAAWDTQIAWPRASVIVCTFNGQRYLDECLSAIQQLDYPDFEVIVVDDGSTDGTAAIASRYPVRLIRTENQGLSAARNTGLRAATGDIVAYIDDDAYPDREWLRHLAIVFMNSDYVGVGGPNIPPPGGSLIADCVAHAPGGPIHVLLSDSEAEHIPGCNMAFRRAPLLAIGGFDPQFRAAGDDVDVCWRVQEQGWKLGFNPTATVFHHRRDTLRAYWKQQVGYGKAEALLERKWPDKYNAAGHLSWAGRIYNVRGLTPPWWGRRGRIYQGTWGTAAYQRVYQPAVSLLGEMPLLPEWYLVIAFLGTLSLIGIIWPPLLVAIPFFVLATASSLFQAAFSAIAASSCRSSRSTLVRLKTLRIAFTLHLMQPLARLSGRLKHGLHPWRRRGVRLLVLPMPKTISIWSQEWKTHDLWLRHLQSGLKSEGTTAFCGGAYDDWDLEIQGGMLAGIRARAVVEEHGAGRQMLRCRIWPRCSALGLFLSVLIGCLAIVAAYDRSWSAAALLGGMSIIVLSRLLYESASAMHKITHVLQAFKTPKHRTEPDSTAAPAETIAVRAVGANND